MEKFIGHQTSSGFVLMGMAVIALVWANWPGSHSYHHIWHETSITLGIGSWSMTESLHFWINDFLMTFFFLVVGFEIKREMAEGELSDPRRAALPVGAAVGGMVVPALIYFAFNPTGPTADGWGIPMATDIAFALGIMVLLGKRIPAALRILLLALAIIDDIGAILVIAIFYTKGFAWSGLMVVGVGCLVLVLFRRTGIRPGLVYFVPLIIIWAGLHNAGVHPTLAGVIVGMSAPVKPWLSREQFLSIAEQSIAEFHEHHASNGEVRHEALLKPINQLTLAGREALSPVVRLQNEFHVWVAFFIMPLFALANAGVTLGALDFDASGATTAMLGIAFGLVVGKPVGIVLVSWLMVRMGWAGLPRGVNWAGILVLGCFAGIGFTMSIFIAELAFANASSILSLGKLSILLATGVATIVGLGLGRGLLSRELDPEVAALTPAQVEASTEY
ncbi:MAG: Na+/H+ antiporter NhaA [Proteobacteria bacterium]|nr:Na+/H+ antiporter NhaA [Pseudomonadota bacterium]